MAKDNIIISSSIDFTNVRNWYLDQTFGMDYSLSDRITALKFQDQVAETIRINLANGDRLSKATKELSKYTTGEDISKKMREIERTAKSVARDTPEYKSFSKTLATVRDEIESKLDDDNILPASEDLANAYLDIVNAADDLNIAGLDSAIEDAIDKKAMYNAFRIAQTEANRAYAKAVYSQAIQDEDCLAMRLDLSSNPNTCDECEELASQDNGGGPGVYAIDETPETPVHVNCRCMLTPVYQLPEGIEEQDLEGGYDGDSMQPIPFDDI
jgi:hypothetical protein